MVGMRSSMSNARHPAVFLTTWLVSAIGGCAIALVALAHLPGVIGELSAQGEVAPLVMMAVVGTLSYNFQTVFPLFVTRDLHGNDATFTVLFSVTIDEWPDVKAGLQARVR